MLKRGGKDIMDVRRWGSPMLFRTNKRNLVLCTLLIESVEAVHGNRKRLVLSIWNWPALKLRG